MTGLASREHRRLVINAITNALYFASTVVVVFFVSPILVHGLGDNRYGAWLLVNSVVAYMALAELGVGASVVRYVSRFDGLHDQDAINRIFSTSLFIFGCVGVVLLLTTSALAIFWARPFGVDQTVADEMRWLLVVLGANLAIAFPLGLYKTVLVGLGQYPIVNAVRISSLIVRNVLLVACVHYDGSLLTIGLAITCGSLLDHVCSTAAAYRYLPGLRFGWRFVDRETLRAIRGYSGYVFLTYIAYRIATESNPLIVGAFLTPTAVTYFGIACSLSNQAGDGLRTAIAVLTPTVSRWDALGAETAIARLLVTGTRYLLYMAVPIQVGLILLGRQFIALWMGTTYAQQCYPALVVFAMPLALVLAQAMSARILEGLGKVAPLFVLTLVQGALVVTLGVALIGPLGIIGVATAATVASVVQSVGVIVIACRAARVPIAKYSWRSWTLPTVAAAYISGVWLLGRWLLPPITTWASFFGTGLGGMALYVPFVVCLDPSLRRIVKSTISGLGAGAHAAPVQQLAGVSPPGD